MANILLAFQGAGLDLAESLAGVAPAGGHFPEGHLPSVRRTMGIEWLQKRIKKKKSKKQLTQAKKRVE
jgi:hypothetical protein